MSGLNSLGIAYYGNTPRESAPNRGIRRHGVTMLIFGIIVVLAAAVLVAAAVMVIERAVPCARREIHNDIVGFVYAVVGAIYAVILAMVVIAAYDSLDDAKANTFTESNALLQLDWYGYSLPQPDHARVENLVKEYASTVINTEWPLLAKGESSNQAWQLLHEIRETIYSQQPTTPAAVARYDQALAANADLGNARRERVEAAADGIPAVLWISLLIGGIVTIGLGYFFGVKSQGLHVAIMFGLTLMIGSLLLVIYALNIPFGGPAGISPDAFTLALERMQGVP
jgi:hypothetical protein